MFPFDLTLPLEKPKEIEMLFLIEGVDFYAIFIKQVQQSCKLFISIESDLYVFFVIGDNIDVL